MATSQSTNGAKKAPKLSSTPAVKAFRKRVASGGGETLYVTITAETREALDAIIMHRLCSRREAVEAAIRRYARELAARAKR